MHRLKNSAMKAFVYSVRSLKLYMNAFYFERRSEQNEEAGRIFQSW